MPRPLYLTQPRWLIGHVIVLVVAVTFVNLGFWQLRRLDERRQHNALVLARSATPGPLPEAGGGSASGQPASERSEPSSTAGPAGELAYRRVTVTGTYDAGHEVLARFRSREGLPGYEVVTPLVVDGGVVLLVDRGWVPLEVGDRWPVAAAAPPAGEVRVEGLLAPPEGGGLRLERRPGRPPVIGAIDVDRLRSAGVLPAGDVYPLHLLAETSAGGYPAPVDPPDLGEGSHLSYALQWFSFTGVVVIGWVLLLSRRARRRP